MSQLKIALAQVNPHVGAVDDNEKIVIDAISQAIDVKADIVIFPELVLTGYPPEDLLYQSKLYALVENALKNIQPFSQVIDIIVGHPVSKDNKLYNAATWFRDGKVLTTYFKQCLPNYEVFDEKRYFTSGHETCVQTLNGLNLGLIICEDGWQSEPVAACKATGAELIIQINASPFEQDKHVKRIKTANKRIQEHGLPMVHIEMVGGQDDLIFDGGSYVINSEGDVCLQMPFFKETMGYATFKKEKNYLHIDHSKTHTVLNKDAMLYQAIVLGLRDYVHKNGFKGALLGLSGGIDSALTLAVAVDALGAENVMAVMMPSRFTAQMSLDDAKAEAVKLGVEYHELSIEPVFETYLETLDGLVGKHGLAAENLQARSRGTLLMAISNQTGKLLLATGNKSEMAVGYSTLYGDMCGAYAPLKDLYKHLVYKLANYRNSLGRVIPQNVIDRPPSAELREDQKDQDSLPDYDVLDTILEAYIEGRQDIDEIVKLGFDKNLVKTIVKMLKYSEYKRAQSAPGPKLTNCSFGRDWRFPITSG